MAVASLLLALADYSPVKLYWLVWHLPGWYAQKHPDEDWAETFAVWLTPGRDWIRCAASRAESRSPQPHRAFQARSNARCMASTASAASGTMGVNSLSFIVRTRRWRGAAFFKSLGPFLFQFKVQS